MLTQPVLFNYETESDNANIVSVAGKAFTIEQASKTWSGAQIQCEYNYGGHLAHVTSKSIYPKLTDALQTSKTNRAWIGARMFRADQLDVNSPSGTLCITFFNVAIKII